MTEIPSAPIEPEPSEPSPVTRPRSRRRLLIAITAGLVVAALAVVGTLVAIDALSTNAVALYTSEVENYSVLAPGEPVAEEIETVLPLGLPTTATHWTEGDLYYSVSSANGEDLPPTPVWRGMFLHDVLIGALGDAPGVSAAALESDAVANAFTMQPEEITVSGAPSYQFTLTVEGAPAPFHIVFTAEPPRLYMIVYSDSDDSRDEDFLESFAFLD